MKVYLIPAAGERYELYCEVPTPEPSSDVTGTSRLGRVFASFRRAFRRMLEEGEAERHGQTEAVERRGRVRRFISRKVAEAVAEQRLLWHLRHESTVELVHPHDMESAGAIAIAREVIGSDLAKHRRWFAIDAILAGITGPLFFFIPGPNVIAWYFAFRAVGHYLALRGATLGLSTVTWTGLPSGELTDLRLALALDADARARRVEQIAAALGLDRLPLFVEKVA